MQPKVHSVETLTRERLEELNAQPGVTVMEHVYDHEFEPRSTADVYDVVKRLATHTLSYDDTGKARFFALKDEEFRAFQADYQTMFEKFTTVEFVRDKRAVDAVMALMQMRRQVERGEVSADLAGSKACEVALSYSMGSDGAGPSASGSAEKKCDVHAARATFGSGNFAYDENSIMTIESWLFSFAIMIAVEPSSF